MLSFAGPLLTHALVVEATAELLEASTLAVQAAVIALELPFPEPFFLQMCSKSCYPLKTMWGLPYSSSPYFCLHCGWLQALLCYASVTFSNNNASRIVEDVQ